MKTIWKPIIHIFNGFFQPLTTDKTKIHILLMITN